MNAPEEPKTILEEAQSLVRGDRRQDYGAIETSLNAIAAMRSVVLSRPITAQEVARCMIAMKLARDVTGQPKRDNCVDIAGYAYLLDQIRDLKGPA